MFDSCTWDDDYNLGVVQTIRQQLVQLATPADGYTAVLLQGSGSYAVEAVLGSVIGEQGKVLIVSNGAYGARMIEMAQLMGIACHPYDCGEVSRPDAAAIEQILQNDPVITHIAMVHSETTTGMLNPIEEVAELAKRYDKRYIVDAMSSFGGIPLDIAALNIDYLISSANKCIQGVPGFAFVIAREAELAACKGRSRSLSLDLYAQWRCMEDNHGKWRFTSPTHTVLAFAQALKELAQEGGVSARHQRYRNNQRRLVAGMRALGFRPLLDDSLHSPIITAFLFTGCAAVSLSHLLPEAERSGLRYLSGQSIAKRLLPHRQHWRSLRRRYHRPAGGYRQRHVLETIRNRHEPY
ncbi:2-aminoethylphosphonate--pyruvate transaminase [Klebsiella pneumoniae]|uniref:2-aminoethylphosphonate--pyruvate transaminase n=1 Tax=Klebsiella pneumoniae TaxID=573 RepID=A0A377XJ94_KLEPN|nr:2-aminoethylphosphonate--pyruvate transaminase [Klebsiella pneumoniae]